MKQLDSEELDSTVGNNVRRSACLIGPLTNFPASTLWDCIAPNFTTHPKRTAIRSGELVMSYQDLQRVSVRLAQAFLDHGASRGSRIGLFLDRSAELIVGALACSRIGAAYVPLDPGYPTDRLSFMAEDADLALVATNSLISAADPWPNLPKLDLASSSTASPGAAKDIQEPGAPPAVPGDAAYVIYTSGTSGRPKGVVISQLAVANFIQSMRERPGLDQEDRFVAVTTPSFDISVLELFLPLAAGSTVIIATPAQAKNGGALRKLIETANATAMQATASTWRVLIDAGWAGTSGFKALIGGEALNAALAEQLLARCGEVWNMYGPTETTVWSSCWQVQSPVSARVSLGDPIANTGIEVLDDKLEPCAPGVAGEIYISGLGLADRYWNRPDETQRRFIECKSGPPLLRRKYRTGDLAKFRPDGSLQYLGRADDQIKLRGYRIEPSEIESRLASHPAIRAAAVTLNELSEGDVRLIAFLVHDESLPTPRELRHYLGQWLPRYMVPQHYLSLESMPLLPNGKVNRRELTASKDHFASQQQLVPARTPIEKQIADIWMDVLALRHVGAEDDFHDLGGQSLFAAQIAARIRQELGHDCQMIDVFRHPTVTQLAAALIEGRPRSEDCIVVPLQSEGSQLPLFCLAGIQLYQPLADHFTGTRPVFGVYAEARAPGPGGGGTDSMIDLLAPVYAAAIRKVQPQGPYHLVGFSFGGALAHEIAIRLLEAGESVGLLCVLDSDAPGHIRDDRRKPLATVRRWLSLRRHGGDRNHSLEAQLEQWIRNHRPRHFAGHLVFIEAVTESQESSFGWDQLAESVTVRHLDTDHLGILKAPQAQKLATIIESALKNTSQDS